jgi:hypothetical protein
MSNSFLDGMPKRAGKTRLTMARGALANTPPRKRHMKSIWKFRATATGLWRIAKRNMPRNIGRFRPHTLESGPKYIEPKTKPSTDGLVVRFIASFETWNCFTVTSVVVLKTDELKVTQIVIRPSMMVMNTSCS